MYASHGFLRSDIGDVDVVFHDGLFHLFHLVLPNHDFIAHAVSEDGLNWRRVKNALYVGEPGAWDDDMLWTMHVTADPDVAGRWRMFYTGLSRAEHGRVQRVGLATSTDLIEWTRQELNGYPVEISNEHYESRIDEGRSWVSFRDPYFFLDRQSGRRLLLSAARVNHGPLVRRGCVGLAEEVEPGRFEFRPPLHQPGLYDDVEVPNLFREDGRYYLLGSIREDTKVHYWYADRLEGPYQNFFDNVLLPGGNYAARICEVGDEKLLFNFFSIEEHYYGQLISRKLLPPPKLLATDATGRLRLKSYPGFDNLVTDALDPPTPDAMDRLFDNPLAEATGDADELHLACPSGYEAFLMPGEYESFRLKTTLALEGLGKCGMVLRVNDEGDGYYLSLDLLKGVAQMRAWGRSPEADKEYAFNYRPLQAGYFVSRDDGPWGLEIVAHGTYLEVSINGWVILSLVDETYACGRIGFYCESSKIMIAPKGIERLSAPRQEEASHQIYTAGCDAPPEDLG